MDINVNDQPSEKENFAPSPLKVSYPELPRLSPAKRQIASRSFKPSPPKKQQIARHIQPGNQYSNHNSSAGIVHSPPNTGRRRVPKLTGALANSPPRPSYADKVKGIFTASSRNSRAHLGKLDHHTAAAAPSVGRTYPLNNNSSTSSSSALTSESELEMRLSTAYDTARHPSNEQWQPVPPPMPYHPPTCNIEMVPTLDPSHVRESVPESTSSDEWTGDEEFLPRAARRQIRMLQLQRRSKEAKETTHHGNPAASPQLLRAVAANDREIRNHLIEMNQIKSPNSSRFRPAGPPYAPCSRLQGDVEGEPADHRSSDADDEAESDA